MKQVGRGQCTIDFPARSRGRTDMALATVLSLFLLSGACLSAPQVHGSERSEAVEGSQPFAMVNPFGAGEEVNSLRQSYIKGNLKEGQSPVLNTWEQEVFFLFSLHDYDKSGQMDGLEMMKLLSDFLSHHSLGPQSADSVVSVVDSLLQTQDLNQDGMLDPSELLSPPSEPQKSKQQAATDTANESISDGTAAYDSHDAAAKEQQQGDSVPGHETQELQEPPQQLTQQEREVQEEQDGGQQELDADKQEVQELPEEAGEVHEEQPEERQVEEPQDQVRERVPAHQGQPEI